MELRLALVPLALAVLAPAATAQDPAPVAAPPAAVPQEPAPAVAPPAAAEPWEVSGSFYYSEPPGSDGRSTAIVYADRGALHLEGRYGYEDLDTGSVFAGWNFETDGAVQLSLTPMIGAVMGQTDGIAPALEVDLGWKRIAWYAEAEYLFDSEDSGDDYFYSWSTLTYALTDSLSVGLVNERTKMVDTGLWSQSGLALELSLASLELSVYTYNVGSDDAYSVVSLGFSPRL